MNILTDFFRLLREMLDFPLLTIGEFKLTLWSFLYLFIFTVLLFYLTALFRRWLLNRLLVKTNMTLAARQTFGSLLRYFVISVGLLIIIQTAGIDLTTLNVLAGAIGLGVGFGLQNIANNFISGIIILFERPIKIADRIEVGDVEGDVVHIGARSTTIVTNDNIAMIVPNSKFISEDVINWSYTDSNVRFKIPISVAYGSDVRLVEKLLLEVARENPDVLEDRAPAVRLLKFGDNGLHFELRAWTKTLTHTKGVLISSLNFAILEKFNQYNIEIPYPQRDVHIRSGHLEMQARKNTPTT
ncbi:MAG: mechanosensitive ion channel [bacterium]|nr:mechanosensitive ion channel [bacterium]